MPNPLIAVLPSFTETICYIVLAYTVEPSYKDPVYKDFPFVMLQFPGPEFSFSIVFFSQIYKVPIYKEIPLIKRLFHSPRQ